MAESYSAMSIPTASYELIIIGTGPGGLFCALNLVRNGYRNILMIDKGSFRRGNPGENVTEGWAGAGAHSDGKVNMTHKVGGTLTDVISMPKFYEYLDIQDQIWLHFMPTSEQKTARMQQNPSADMEARMFKPGHKANQLRAKALANHMELQTYSIRHLGTDNMLDSTFNMYDYLEKNGVTIRLDMEVSAINKNDNGIFNVTAKQNDGYEHRLDARNVLIATGRSGGHFFKKTMENLKVAMTNNGVDIGVRVEVPNDITAGLLQAGIYEPKMLYRTPTFDDPVRTFCWCDSGYVALEEYRDTGIKTVNGHSFADKKSDNTNFALLVTKTFTEPFNDPQAYAESISKMANLLSGGNVLVQRYGDFKEGRRTTPSRLNEGALIPTLDTAIPGDLSLVIPYRQMLAISEMLEAMDKVLPGIASKYTLLYGIEAKFYSNKVKIDEHSMTEIDGLYIAGDGSGWTRGLNQAAIQGLMVSEGLLGKSKY